MELKQATHTRTQSLENTEQLDILWSSLPCANMIDNGSQKMTQCNQPATMFCSKCRLVKYCSKMCQNNHWKDHRKACNHPLRSSAWKPAWEAEGRAPTFVTDEEETMQQTMFGRLTYIWGNTPAADYLNVQNNEGLAIIDQDLKLCFAASGDIRNLVKTVNGLPENYRGKCDIFFNDKSSLVTNHNLVVLYALLNPAIPLERAINAAIHLMYSSALTPSMTRDFDQCVQTIYANKSSTLCWSGELSTRGCGKLRFTQMTNDSVNTLRMYLSNYPLRDALQSMRDIMMSPHRLDHRHRHMLMLKSEHRLPYEYFRNQGILSPFSVDTTSFTEPNRTVFGEKGQWLSMDSTNPLYGWDMTDARASAKRHGAEAADIYGCLFFHLVDEFKTFSKRIQNCNINIHITQFEAERLSKMILRWTSPSETGLNVFDRIDTSNIIDYVGISPILTDWGPLLNKHNPYATLLAASMNWHARNPSAQAQNQTKLLRSKLPELVKLLGIDPQHMRSESRRDIPSGLTVAVLSSIGIIHDDEAPFQAYLRQEGAQDAARRNKLQIRPHRRICAKRLGHTLADGEKMPTYTQARVYDVFTLGGGEPEVRFLEFENLPAA